MSQFYYTTCQMGAEKAVKAEVLSAHPSLRFAFSRPGFITFKQEADQKMIEEGPGIFTRVWGRVVGQAKDATALKELLEQVPVDATLHAFDRDTFEPGQEPKSYQPTLKAMQTLEEIRYHHPLLNSPAKELQWVYDLIWVDDFHLFLGRHMHLPKQDTSPGSRPVFADLKEVPSRAYYKLMEAWQRFQPELPPKSQVLELGSSPGGASQFLLEQGFHVYAVDPKKPLTALMHHEHFHYLQKPARALSFNDLQKVNPTAIIMDINLAPPVALQELDHVIQVLNEVNGRYLRLGALFLTLKLNEWKLTEQIPIYLKKVKGWKFEKVKAVQLASNHREFLLWAGR